MSVDPISTTSRTGTTSSPSSTTTTTNTTAPTNQSVAPAAPSWNCGGNLYNCPDFSSCSEMWSYWNTCPGDPSDLDGDSDGVPCESQC
jgi:hypothetical protein